MGNLNGFKIIAWVATLFFAVVPFFASGPSTYRFAFFFLAPLIWCVYIFRARLEIHVAHFGFFALALAVHNLGAFGAYGDYFLGLEFDTYVHFIFGVAGGLIVARSLQLRLGLAGWKMWVGTILLILGVGAIHELFELLTTLILGPEKGMLKLNDPDRFDTQKDLGNNLLGTLAALILYAGFRLGAPPRTASVHQ